MVVVERDLSPALRHQRHRSGLIRKGAIAVLLLLAAGVLVHRYVILRDHVLFWDLRVYAAAIKAHGLGLDPYRPEVFDSMGVEKELKYTSTPMVDSMFAALSHAPFVQSWFQPVTLFLHFSAIIAIVWVMTALFLGSGLEAGVIGAVIFALMFATAGLNTFAAANNGTILYGLIVVSAYRGFVKKRWLAFHMCVTLASMVKPIYAPLWLLPIFADRFSSRQLTIAVCGGVLAACSYLAFAVIDPATVQEWLANMRNQAGQTTNDLGDNIFSALYSRNQSHVWWPIAGQLIFDLALLTIALTGNFTGRLRWAALFTVAIFVNPRLMAYDSAVASIPVMSLAAYALSTGLAPATRLLIVGYPLMLACIILPYRSVAVVPGAVLLPALVFAILLLAAFRSRFAEGPQASALHIGDVRSSTSSGGFAA